MNISDIAKMAGVSPAAVSRYLNQGYISEEKKEAIRRVIAQTGYTPSQQAQTLRTKRTKVIGVVIPRSIPNLFRALSPVSALSLMKQAISFCLPIRKTVLIRN